MNLILLIQDHLIIYNSLGTLFRSYHLWFRKKRIERKIHGHRCMYYVSEDHIWMDCSGVYFWCGYSHSE